MSSPDDERYTHGDPFVRMLQDKLEGERRRVEDDGMPRMHVLDGQTREIVAHFVEEIMKHVDARIEKALGVPQDTHRRDHIDLAELGPFLRAQQRKAQKWADLLEKATSDLFIRCFQIISTVVLLAFAYGFVRAVNAVFPLLGQ